MFLCPSWALCRDTLFLSNGARDPLPFKLYIPQPSPLLSRVTSADWPPMVQSFRGSFQPPFQIPQFQPFYTTNARIQTFTSGHVRPLSSSLAKVKSYGSVKATLLASSFPRQYIPPAFPRLHRRMQRFEIF